MLFQSDNISLKWLKMIKTSGKVIANVFKLRAVEKKLSKSCVSAENCKETAKRKELKLKV